MPSIIVGTVPGIMSDSMPGSIALGIIIFGIAVPAMKFGKDCTGCNGGTNVSTLPIGIATPGGIGPTVVAKGTGSCASGGGGGGTGGIVGGGKGGRAAAGTGGGNGGGGG